MTASKFARQQAFIVSSAGYMFIKCTFA